MGIGTTNPGAKLEVAGSVKLPAIAGTAGKTILSNTMTTYEQGTWVPVLSTGGDAFATNTVGSSAVNQGAYTRIGNLVTVQGILNSTGVSGGSGVLRITGFPFSARSNVGAVQYVPIAMNSANLDTPAGCIGVFIQMESGASVGSVMYSVDNAANIGSAAADAAGSIDIRFTGSYYCTD